MFENLNERFTRIVKNLTGQGRLTEENIQDTLKQVRIALLEADVALPVVKTFIEDIREKALGQTVQTSLNPGQALIKIVNDALIVTMGEAAVPLNFQCPKPAVILMAGLQGSGKTTSVGKLANYLKEQEKSVLVTSCDIYRPAAIEQLASIAKQLDILFEPVTPGATPVQIAMHAITKGKQQFVDVVIIDTAGRLHIDDEMMSEIKTLHQATDPIETLFVVDSMTGQDAANTAKAFNEALPLTGVILTKIDGDTRGGAALSIRQITGKPIKFLGIGEKLTALEVFHPDRIASRILGMGDVLSLIEDIEKKVDQQKAEKLAKKIKKGHGFDLEDFRDQLAQFQNMGDLMGMMDKIPGFGQLAKSKMSQFDPKVITRTVAIINSMTIKERRFPTLLNGSRKRRIAAGSGTQVPEINQLLKQFMQMQKMMKKMGKPGSMKKMMRGMQGMLPPGSSFPPDGIF